MILDDQEISQYVHDEGFVGQWFKTSAKTGEGIQVRINTSEVKTLPKYYRRLFLRRKRAITLNYQVDCYHGIIMEVR